MIKLFNKKTVTLVFIALIIVLILPKPAFAAVPTFETNPILVGEEPVVNAANAAANVAGKVQQFLEWAFKMATELLKKQLLDMMVDQIVNWIQGGGEPKFITDWSGFFKDAADQAGGKFIQKLGLASLCSPIKPLLSASFIPITPFTTLSCTFSEIGVNIDNFLNDFRQGKWIAWREMVLKPQNNIYGAYILAWDQYEFEKAAAVKASESEAKAGQGFLSVKRCVQSHLEYHSEVDPDGNTMQVPTTICDKEEIVTPGFVAGELVAKAVGSDIDFIVNSQDLTAYVAAIANALLNRMFSEGVGLLGAAFSSGGGGGGSNAQTQCFPLLNTPAYNNCLANVQSGTDYREFQKNYLISLIDQDLDYQNQLLGAKQTTLIILDESLDILTQLYNCQATSSPGLAQQTQITLTQVQNAASTTASQIPQIQSDILSRQEKKGGIEAITELSQILPIYNEITALIDPVATNGLVFAAQQENSQRQQDRSLYQQKLTLCLYPPGGP